MGAFKTTLNVVDFVVVVLEVAVVKVVVVFVVGFAAATINHPTRHATRYHDHDPNRYHCP